MRGSSFAVKRPTPVPPISSFCDPAILSNVSCRITVCDTPESTNAKNSVVPDRSLIVGRDLHVGSPLTLFICPANCRRTQRLGACMLALLSGDSTAPRRNGSSWIADTRDNGRSLLRSRLLESAAAEESKCGVKRFVAAALLDGHTAGSVGGHPLQFCLSFCVVHWAPCGPYSCTQCKHPWPCAVVLPTTDASLASP